MESEEEEEKEEKEEKGERKEEEEIEVSSNVKEEPRKAQRMEKLPFKRAPTSKGRRADLLAIQVQALEDTVGKELQALKEAALLTEKEKVALQRELDQIRNAGPLPQKKKIEEGEESSSLQNTVKDLVKAVDSLNKKMEEREQAHEEEKDGWKEEIRLLKDELMKNREEEIQLRLYCRARDQVFASNWSEKFKGKTPYPPFPNIFPPEAVTNAPYSGAEQGPGEQ